ncbi:MAG: copper chaperone PCu(A)C [Rhodospirillales bacterium]|nr:copper chaperone PCu(A)C [Rhodospirillales bacterium]
MTRPSWRQLLPVGLAIVAAAGVARAQNAAPDGLSHPTAYEAQSFGIYLRDFWVRLPVAGARTTAAYFVLENRSESGIRLVSVASPVAEATELHEVIADADGVMRMRPLTTGIPVPPGGTEELRPGGRHVMLIGLRDALTPDSVVPMSLRFADGLTVDVKAPVLPPEGRAAPEERGGAHQHHDATHEEHQE